jgi:hypothetical protein
LSALLVAPVDILQTLLEQVLELSQTVVSELVAGIGTLQAASVRRVGGIGSYERTPLLCRLDLGRPSLRRDVLLGEGIDGVGRARIPAAA